MITTTVRDARINFSRLLKRVERGENIIIRNRFTPVARIVPYHQEQENAFPDLTAFRRQIAEKRSFKPGKAELQVRADREGRG